AEQGNREVRRLSADVPVAPSKSTPERDLSTYHESGQALSSAHLRAAPVHSPILAVDLPLAYARKYQTSHRRIVPAAPYGHSESCRTAPTIERPECLRAGYGVPHDTPLRSAWHS